MTAYTTAFDIHRLGRGWGGDPIPPGDFIIITSECIKEYLSHVHSTLRTSEPTDVQLTAGSDTNYCLWG